MAFGETKNPENPFFADPMPTWVKKKCVVGCKYNMVFEFSINLQDIVYGPDPLPTVSIILEENKYMECKSKLDFVNPKPATIINKKSNPFFSISECVPWKPTCETFALRLEIEEDKGEKELKCVDNDPQTKDCAGCDCNCVAGPARKTWKSASLPTLMGFFLSSEVTCHPPADCECLWDATEDAEINTKLEQLLTKLANNGGAATRAAVVAYESCKAALTRNFTWEKELQCRQAGLDAAAKELDKDGALSKDLKELGCPNHEGSPGTPSWK